MGYELLDEGTFADVAVRCTADKLEDLFAYNAKALVEIIIQAPFELSDTIVKKIQLKDEDIDLLLFDYMNELIYQKDVNNLLLLPGNIQVEKKNSGYMLTALMKGDRMSKKCSFNVDVKAATMHELKVIQNDEGWESFIILDV